MALRVRVPGNCWEIADRNLRHYQEALKAALRGEGKANPEVCRDMLDKWLEYRHSHGPDDESRL
jgi:hypothetical protein